MKMSAQIGVRIFAVLNVLFGVAGLVLLVLSFRVPSAGADELRYFAEAYYARVVVNLVCLLALLFAGVSLWRLERRALLLSNLVYSAEIVYFVGVAALPVELFFAQNETANHIGRAIGATGGSGNMGLVLQLMTGYPLIALVLLNIVYRRQKQASVSGL